jgi:hypothetical protein
MTSLKGCLANRLEQGVQSAMSSRWKRKFGQRASCCRRACLSSTL